MAEDDPALAEDLRRIESRLRSSAKSLDKLGLASVIEANIVAELLEGRKTVAELVEGLYQVPRDNPHYSAYYDKARRAAGSLESKGYVARRLFGRDKPYKLTRLGWGRILAASLDAKPPRTIPGVDAILYLTTLTLGGLCWLLSAGTNLSPGTGSYLALFSAFLIAAGMSIVKFLETMRGII